MSSPISRYTIKHAIEFVRIRKSPADFLPAKARDSDDTEEVYDEHDVVNVASVGVGVYLACLIVNASSLLMVPVACRSPAARWRTLPALRGLECVIVCTNEALSRVSSSPTAADAIRLSLAHTRSD